MKFSELRELIEAAEIVILQADRQRRGVIERSEAPSTIPQNAEIERLRGAVKMIGGSDIFTVSEGGD